MTLRNCRRCHATKPASEFYASDLQRKGAWCKACNREYERTRVGGRDIESIFRRIQKRTAQKKQGKGSA